MKPRVLYLGYGGIGCFCLEQILDAGFDVVGVLCRASDRTERPEASSSVFTTARLAGLHLFTATNPSDPGFVAEARSLAPDLLLSIQYDRILKPALLSVPRHGAYNLHFGPLPRLRGCFPTKWAILDDEPAGVTFHCIDPGIDSGDLIDQTLVPLAPGETDETLYGKLVEAGKELFVRQIPWMRKLAAPRRIPQDSARASYYPKRLPHDGVIDWSRGTAWADRFLRAFTFPPFPAAKTWIEGMEVQLRAPVEIDPEPPGTPPGTFKLRGDGTLAVSCGDGSVLVRTVLVGGEEKPAASLAGTASRFTEPPS
ncbi:MAG TPA: methionyl-tRNA formyltransferase [Thermoanaerobaculia bacterium]|nr:methionyl-tRNA formyltransferase [Thermoanaerobaculia bacterium]